MKVILSTAMSANGIIADKNGSEDFLSHENWLRFSELANRIGNNVWGRKTYEAVKSWSGKYLDSIKDVTKVVVTKNTSIRDTNFVFVDSPKNAISYLTKRGFNEMLVTGGQSIYSAFLNESLVDEIIFDINPILMDSGIHAFRIEKSPLKLKLLSSQKINDDLVEVHYKLLK